MDRRHATGHGGARRRALRQVTQDAAPTLAAACRELQRNSPEVTEVGLYAALTGLAAVAPDARVHVASCLGRLAPGNRPDEFFASRLAPIFAGIAPVAERERWARNLALLGIPRRHTPYQVEQILLHLRALPATQLPRVLRSLQALKQATRRPWYEFEDEAMVISLCRLAGLEEFDDIVEQTLRDLGRGLGGVPPRVLLTKLREEARRHHRLWRLWDGLQAFFADPPATLAMEERDHYLAGRGVHFVGLDDLAAASVRALREHQPDLSPVTAIEEVGAYIRSQKQLLAQRQAPEGRTFTYQQLDAAQRALSGGTTFGPYAP